MAFWNKLRSKLSLGAIGDYESDELLLYMDNDERIYRQMNAIRLNLIKHYCRGNFDSTKAVKGFSYATDEANRKYKKEFDYAGFTPAQRNEVNKELTARFKRDVNRCLGGNCNDVSQEEAALLKSSKCKVSTPLAGKGKKMKGKSGAEYCVHFGDETHRPMNTLCSLSKTGATRLVREARRDGTPARMQQLSAPGGKAKGKGKRR